MEKKKQFISNPEKFGAKVFLGTAVAGAIAGGVSMAKLHTYYNSDAALNSRIEQSFTQKMGEEERDFSHFLEMLNNAELELANGTTAEQVKEKYLEKVAPTKMDEAKSENKEENLAIRMLGGLSGSALGLLLGGLLGVGTSILAEKGANKLNTLVANRRKEDEENTL